MAFRIDHLHMKSDDPRATANFYIDAVGGTLLNHNDEGTVFRVNLHGVPVTISGLVENPTRPQHLGMEHLALETDDFDAAVERLKGQGSRELDQFVSPIRAGMRISILEAPDGVQLELIETKSSLS